MKVIITGSSGMIGGLILQNCCDSDQITEIISMVRKRSHIPQNTKIKEVVIDDFNNYSAHSALFENVGAAFFCIGVYTGSVADDVFKKITVDYAVSFARTLKTNSPQAKLCLLSGAGADRSEKSKAAFARYKGMAENQISKMGLSFYTFRPSYIYPVTARKEPNFMYRLSRAIYPILKLFGDGLSIRSTELAFTMFHVGLHGAQQEILENKDIKKIYHSLVFD